MLGLEKATFEAIGQLGKSDGHRYAVMEINRGCNRRCVYCTVPSRWNPEEELTVAETRKNIDWLYDQGTRALSIEGGEPLEESLYTKDGIPFYEHTLAAVEYASKKKILVGIATNGDYLTRDKARDLRKSGLLSLTLSFHTPTRNGLNHLIKVGRLAAEERLIPTIQVVATNQIAGSLPGIAAHAAENGILSSITVVQEKGDNFSAVPTEESLVPNLEQFTPVLRGLRALKNFGLVRNNWNFLSKSLDYYPNQWKCDPEKNYFVHIGAGGTIDRCQEARSVLTIDDIGALRSEKWRQQKQELVENCTGCLYQCYFEASNPDIKGDLATIGVALLIRNGRAGLVRKWGQFAASRVKKLEPDIDWSLNLN